MQEIPTDQAKTDERHDRVQERSPYLPVFQLHIGEDRPGQQFPEARGQQQVIEINMSGAHQLRKLKTETEKNDENQQEIPGEKPVYQDKKNGEEQIKLLLDREAPCMQKPFDKRAVHAEMVAHEKVALEVEEYIGAEEDGGEDA